MEILHLLFCKLAYAFIKMLFSQHLQMCYSEGFHVLTIIQEIEPSQVYIMDNTQQKCSNTLGQSMYELQGHFCSFKPMFRLERSLFCASLYLSPFSVAEFSKLPALAFSLALLWSKVSQSYLTASTTLKGKDTLYKSSTTYISFPYLIKPPPHETICMPNCRSLRIPFCLNHYHYFSYWEV